MHLPELLETEAENVRATALLWLATRRREELEAAENSPVEARRHLARAKLWSDLILMFTDTVIGRDVPKAA